jgi:DNA-binding NarL/FixJ family response regulator
MRDAIRQVLALSDALELVGEARDGVEAVEQAELLQPDVMLLDLSMPRRDGLEALPLVRAASPDTRVVVLSGFDEAVASERALELGAERYVQKGVDPGALIAMIEEVGRG